MAVHNEQYDEKEIHYLKIQYMLNIRASSIKYTDIIVPTEGYESQCTVDLSIYDNLLKEYDDLYWALLMGGSEFDWEKDSVSKAEGSQEDPFWIEDGIEEPVTWNNDQTDSSYSEQNDMTPVTPEVEEPVTLQE